MKREEPEIELSKLCMRRVIKEIQHGHRIYQIASKKINPEGIVKEVLLTDINGDRIGYFTGASFLRSLGSME